ncbi:MAG TPA: glycoside hydrolase domain-containing protein [Phycisphaerae bacterium]|nr:glycoside hydrolase domain-containing protein [Phycisphaerae bacterium]
MAAMSNYAETLTPADMTRSMSRTAIHAATVARGVALGLLLAAAPLALGQTPRSNTALRVHVSDIHDQEDSPAAGAPAFVRIVAARNGTYSGKVVAGSSGPIRGLKAACGALKAPGGAVIPASAVQVRYGLPWASGRSRRTPNACLSETPLAECAASGRGGAAAPVWVTIRVPKEASPGLYMAELTVSAQGARPTRVPLRLTVVDWTLPDPSDYVSWVDLYQVPDTSAVEYGVPLWSERHWQYIARSLKLLGELGNKTLYIPLIAHTNMGNAETMVRWIEKGQNRFGYDFSIAEKYLDLAAKHLGEPKVVTLVVWELYMLPDSAAMSDDEARSGGWQGRAGRVVRARQAMNIRQRGGKLGMGPLVTEVDPATGKTENVFLPPYTEPQSRALWAPVISGMRQRLRKRSPAATMMLGVGSDAPPSKAEVAFFSPLTGNAPWVVQSHYGHPTDKLLHGIAKVGYQTRVWGGIRFADGQRQTNQQLPPSSESQHGWKSPDRVAVFERNAGLDTYPVARWRFFVETCITSTACGVGRLGGDFWFAIKDKRGRRAGNVAARYPESHRRNLNLCNCILAPAPEGPAATDRYEAFREGLQECEARIVIERSLIDARLRARLGPELARRGQAALDERLKCMWKSLSNNPGAPAPGMWRWHPGIAGHKWFLSSGWQDRSAKLYQLAGEVERKLAGR